MASVGNFAFLGITSRQEAQHTRGRPDGVPSNQESPMTHNRFFGKVAFTALAVLGTSCSSSTPGGGGGGSNAGQGGATAKGGAAAGGAGDGGQSGSAGVGGAGRGGA